MKVVIDVGCATHPEEDSIAILVDRFQPDVLFGFDPLVRDHGFRAGNTAVYLRDFAAWTYDGQIGFREERSRSRISPEDTHKVACFDLAQFILDQDEPSELILKLDVESAEYFLLPHLHTRHVDEVLSLAIVEWHRQFDPDRAVEDEIRRTFAAPIEDWTH